MRQRQQGSPTTTTMAREKNPEIRYANPHGGRLHFASSSEDNVIFVGIKRVHVIERAVEHAVNIHRAKRGEAAKPAARKKGSR